MWQRKNDAKSRPLSCKSTEIPLKCELKVQIALRAIILQHYQCSFPRFYRSRAIWSTGRVTPPREAQNENVENRKQLDNVAYRKWKECHTGCSKEWGWNNATHYNPIESDFKVLPRLAGKGGDKLSGQSVEKSWGQRHISLLVVLAAFPMAILCTRTIPPLNGSRSK